MSEARRHGARIAVVGGGPAGATCARRLARSGVSVDLFEGRPGAEKPCGGGVPAAGLEEFPELVAPELPRRVVRDLLLCAPSGRRARLRLPAGIHVFRRLDLDSFLRRRAAASGARVVEARVTRVRRAAGSAWELDTNLGPMGPYSFLVGADGVQGGVRSFVACGGRAGRWADSELTLALYAHLPRVVRDDIVLRFFPDLDGYLWAFPRVDHLSVGACASHRTVGPDRLREELARFVERDLPGACLDRSAIKGYFIPASPAPPAPAAGEGWALVGDAGGFVDAITREGIAHAMRSGASLARLLSEERTIRTPALPRDLVWPHRHRRGFYRPDRLEGLVRLTAASSAIRRVVADLFEGRQRYATLKARLVLNALLCGAEVAWGRLARRPSHPGHGAAGRAT